MRYKLISSAVLGLGASLIATSPAMADRDYRDRDYERSREVYRDERRSSERVERMEMRDVPKRVRDRVNDYRHGRGIESVEYVRRDGDDFYRFRIDDRDHGDFYLDIAPNGHLLGRVNR